MGDQKRASLEQVLGILDRRIEDLKIKYNLFFSGDLNIPPEKERGDVEKEIRGLVASEQKSARIAILTQNLASKFAIYNNMWLKRLHEIEVGIVPLQKKKPQGLPDQDIRSDNQKLLLISLNDEDSFEKFFNMYSEMSKKKKIDKDKIINSLKTKMITANLIDAKVNLVSKQGKVRISLKN